MNTAPSKYDILSSMAARKQEMENIHNIVKELLKKVKQLNNRHDELKSLNFLDEILLKELEENGTD